MLIATAHAAGVRAWQHPAPTAAQPPSLSCGAYVSLPPHRSSPSCAGCSGLGPFSTSSPTLFSNVKPTTASCLLCLHLCLRSHPACVPTPACAATSSWDSSSPPRPPSSPRSTCWSSKSAWTPPSPCPLRSSGALDGWTRPGWKPWPGLEPLRPQLLQCGEHHRGACMPHGGAVPLPATAPTHPTLSAAGGRLRATWG